MSMMVPDDEVFKRCDELGAYTVRTFVQTGRFPASFQDGAIRWLDRKDAENRAARAKAATEELEIARSAKDAAWASADAARISAKEAGKANTRATIALILAVFSFVLAGFGVYVQHRDAGQSSKSNN